MVVRPPTLLTAVPSIASAKIPAAAPFSETTVRLPIASVLPSLTLLMLSPAASIPYAVPDLVVALIFLVPSTLFVPLLPYTAYTSPEVDAVALKSPVIVTSLLLLFDATMPPTQYPFTPCALIFVTVLIIFWPPNTAYTPATVPSWVDVAVMAPFMYILFPPAAPATAPG